MNFVRRITSLLIILSLGLVFEQPILSQTLTGAITGRAQDSSGAMIPGVEVRISSPAMIEGGRTAITDEQGSYRFTLLSAGTYRVTFALQGFKTLNIEDVVVPVGTTMTINGTLDVAALAEEVSVTSDVPTIDLEAAAVGVNWNQQKFDNLPFGRAIQGLVAMIPGLYTTSYDVGGSTKGGPASAVARTFGRNGGNVQTSDLLTWVKSR